ncbi:MAG: dTDP-4-dehydrorhamnose reductase [Caballeronia sp.]|jgi:dTDP-4-dehydrorhamnose reductase|nr:dTDP-4-dehydrorhamnose reductase [Caballeronia sp.]
MRALVVGADGLIGAALVSAWRQRCGEVVGTTRRREAVRSAEMVLLDLADEDAAFESLPAADVAFICAAMTKLTECRESPGLAERVNFTAPVRLARRLVARGTRVVFLSTSAVMNCREPQMRAERPRYPSSVYGRWKAAAEEAILALGEGATVVRLTKVLTPDAPLLANWMAALAAGEEIVVFNDHRIAPIGVQHAVDTLIAIGDQGEGGVYQVSGARDMSYEEVARHLAKRIGAPQRLVTGCPAASRGIAPEDVLPFTSLDVSRLAALTGFVAPDPYALIDSMFDAQVGGRKAPAPRIAAPMALGG